MGIAKVPKEVRTRLLYHFIDPGFINRRLCQTALPPEMHRLFRHESKSGDDHYSRLQNDHLLVEMLIELCDEVGTPCLIAALNGQRFPITIKSDLQVSPNEAIWDGGRIVQDVVLNSSFDVPVRISYDTSHIVSDTCKMTLSEGTRRNYVHSVIGRLHDRGDHFEIEPIVIGHPWLDHPRNSDVPESISFFNRSHGEVLPEDIDEFSSLLEVNLTSANEWTTVMRELPEQFVKEAIASILNDPVKKDWGGEANDHFTSSITLNGRRRTAAFMLKGPARWAPLTHEMCGKRGDQVHRLVMTGADLSIVQHCHEIGAEVRMTTRMLSNCPGQSRLHCFLDGKTTYRLLKSKGFI